MNVEKTFDIDELRAVLNNAFDENSDWGSFAAGGTIDLLANSSGKDHDKASASSEESLSEPEQEIEDPQPSLVEHSNKSQPALSGTASPLLTAITVEGVGELPIPLSHNHVRKLRALAKQAPFGRGQDTVVDLKIRESWEIDQAKISAPETHPNFFTETVQQITHDAVLSLGVDPDVVQTQANLYKLLMYEKGGHFLSHRDTEKEPGMFATLVILLPTEGGYTGGALNVKHDGETKAFDFSSQSTGPMDFHHIIFFADCEHELLPITDGVRLCLVFNIVRKKSTAIPPTHLAPFTNAVSELETLLSSWVEAEEEDFDAQKLCKMGIRLKHKYTTTNISFSGLKGEDQVLAELLKCCKRSDGSPAFDVHLCIIEKHESGGCDMDYDDYDDYYGGKYYCVPGCTKRWCCGGYGSYDEDGEEDEEEESEEERPPPKAKDHHEMTEVYETSITTKMWVDSDNKETNFSRLSIDVEEEILTLDEDEEVFDVSAGPDQEDYEGYTGNAGPSLDYWYFSAVVVIWPRCWSFRMALEDSPASAIRVVERMINAKEPIEKIRLATQRILENCAANPKQYFTSTPSSYSFLSYQASTAENSGSLPVRLLRCFVRTNDPINAVKLLNLMAKKFVIKNQNHWGYGAQETVVYEGIAGTATIQVLLSAIKTLGWTAVKDPILALLSKEQLANYGSKYVLFAASLARAVKEEKKKQAETAPPTPKAAPTTIQAEAAVKVDTKEEESELRAVKAELKHEARSEMENKLEPGRSAVVSQVEPKPIKKEPEQIAVKEEAVAPSSSSEGAQQEFKPIKKELGHVGVEEESAVGPAHGIKREPGQAEAAVKNEVASSGISNEEAKLTVKTESGEGRKPYPEAAADNMDIEPSVPSSSQEIAPARQTPAADVKEEKQRPTGEGMAQPAEAPVPAPQAADIKQEKQAPAAAPQAADVKEEHKVVEVKQAPAPRRTTLDSLRRAESAVANKVVSLFFSVGFFAVPPSVQQDGLKLLLSKRSFFEQYSAQLTEEIVKLPPKEFMRLLIVIQSDIGLIQKNALSSVETKSREAFRLLLCKRFVEADFFSSSSPQDLCKDFPALVKVFTGTGDVQIVNDLAAKIIRVSRSFPTQVLLKTLTSHPKFQEVCRNVPVSSKLLIWFMRRILAERIRYLSALVKPDFTWCQSQASLPGHPKVQEFLRGPATSFRYTGSFQGIQHVRNFCSKHFGTSVSDGYSATAAPGGRGRTAYCDITKTKGHHNAQLRRWMQDQEELKQLTLLLQKTNSSAECSALQRQIEEDDRTGTSVTQPNAAVAQNAATGAATTSSIAQTQGNIQLHHTPGPRVPAFAQWSNAEGSSAGATGFAQLQKTAAPVSEGFGATMTPQQGKTPGKRRLDRQKAPAKPAMIDLTDD